MRKILSYGNCLCLLFALTYSIQSTAQKTPQQVEELKKNILQDPSVTSVQINNVRQTPSFITLKTSQQAYAKGQAANALNTYLNVRAGVDELRPVKEVQINNSISVIEYRQYYKGIKVEHARYTAFIKNGNISFYNGAWFNIPSTFNLNPKISKANGLQRAKESTRATKYAWEQVEEALAKEKNANTKAALQAELNEYGPKGELVIVMDHKAQGVAQMRLAYKFDIYAVQPVSRAWVYIDAEDGRILFRDEIIKHVGDNPTSVATSVQTRYAGVRTIKTKQISGNDPNSGLPLIASNPTEIYVPGTATYALIDDSKGGGIETYDLNGVGGLPISVPPSYAQGKSFTDINNNWTVAEHKRGGAVEAENDDIAWDAHWGAGIVYDYWKQKHNRLSYDGNDAKIKSYIHSGVGYDNAFWNGSVMTYGDGSYPAPGGFKPLTSLDVCGHEIGHGICSFTSDLAYEKESGAMNEALSDIWAACIEYFAIKSIDPSLASVYKPFYIGEQISADPTQPLRRMDNPKAATNPDTYGGQYWSNANCSPSLANDQCGVHNNSGVLNKWFYLLTVGSGAGSGPNAAYAGQDDGVNDLGNAYSVQGLGFDLSEKLVYMTEMMLTSTATYAEARAVSIQVAIELSGNPCSSLVKSVTDAWYAVGVGDAFVQPCLITYGFIYQPGSFVNEAQSGAGCTAETAVRVPVLLPANSSATITASGTASSLDYRLSATTLSNTTSSLKQDSIFVYVKNDGVIESDETVILNIAVTNVGANKVNSTYTLTIVEDDVVPVISSATKTLLNESFTRADGFADPAGWTEILEVPEDPNGTQAAKGKNQWGIFGNKLAITGRDEITGTQLLGGTYNNNSLSTTIIKSPFIDARGLNTLKLQFDYQVQGEEDPSGANPDTWPALDYMAIVYSFDGNTWYEFSQPPFFRFASATSASGNFNVTLPAFLNNKQFYLGFRWNNDPLLGGPISVSVDNLTLQASARRLENELNQNGRENLNAGQEVYFYSAADGELLGRVKNNSTNNFGCTNLFLEKTGTGAFNLYQEKSGSLHKVSDKVLRIETSSIYKASQTVTLYFTEAQLQGLELATGQARTAFSVYQVSAATYSQAATNNTKRYPATYTAIPGEGGYYTVTFTEKLNGSFALGCQVSALGLRTVPSELTMDGSKEWKFGNIYPNPGRANAILSVQSPQQQKVVIEVVNVNGQLVHSQTETLNEGINSVQLQVHALGTGSYFVRMKNEDGKMLNNQQYHRF